ncbi:MAG: hypothetical protein D6714_02125 [Bacteroidetes bacterium]|nr:MAG: hypothetical protein D6714_02125 [Bacteroidota bacterium]
MGGRRFSIKNPVFMRVFAGKSGTCSYEVFFRWKMFRFLFPGGVFAGNGTGVLCAFVSSEKERGLLF